MGAVEIACALVLALYAATHARAPRWLGEAGLLAIAGWLGEVTCIRAYGFYQYDPSAWRARLDVMPLVVALIWPAVILSAREIARRLLGERARPHTLAALTGALVLFDAALIEPIAVRAGLWSWNEPGLFGVPIIGLLGWGYFAMAATWVLERWPGRASIALVLVAPLAAHVLLVASWWSALRWVLRGDVSPWSGAVVVVVASLAYLRAVVRGRIALPAREVIPRAAATLFFGVLLVRAVSSGGALALALYAALFTPPHLAMSTPRRNRVSRAVASRARRARPRRPWTSARRSLRPRGRT